MRCVMVGWIFMTSAQRLDDVIRVCRIILMVWGVYEQSGGDAAKQSRARGKVSHKMLWDRYGTKDGERLGRRK